MNDEYTPQELSERDDIAEYAVAIKQFLDKAWADDEDGTDDPYRGYRNTRSILDAVGRDKIRLWEPALDMLVGEIEMRNGAMTYYRRCERRVIVPQTGSNAELYRKERPVDRTFPYAAYKDNR